MPAETYKGIEFDSQFEVIPADVIESKADMVEELADRSLLPNSEDARDIGKILAVLSLAADAIPQGLLINNRSESVPILSRDGNSMAAMYRSDGSVVLWRLYSNVPRTVGQCQFKDGELARSGYLDLHVKDFRFAGGQDAGVFDARTDYVSRNSTAIFAQVSKLSTSVNERDQALRAIWTSLFVLPSPRR